MSSPKQNVDFELALKSGGSDDAPVSWNRRDLLLYAVGVGAGPEELDYTYEVANNFRAIPSYPLVLGLKGNFSDTNVFAEQIASRSGTPGLPVLDPNTIVHGEQSLTVHAPIPVISGDGWKLKKRLVAVHDKPGALVTETEVRLVSPVGRTHATMVGSTFFRGGGQGTAFTKSLVDKPPSVKPPTRAADFTLEETTSPAQAAIYRLSGDYNPLHIDPSIGQKGGLGGVILHGLCSYGYAVRAVLRAVNPSDGKIDAPASELKTIYARFTSPVRPGAKLVTSVWILGEKNGAVEVAFEQIVHNPGVKPTKSLGGGYALVQVPKQGTAKL